MIEPMKLRIGNLELRNSTSDSFEVVRWIDNERPVKVCNQFCIVIAFLRRTSEGYEYQFVGQRPFDPEVIDVWPFLRMCQNIANSIYEFEEEVNES
jgi:hypothetical protein